jgi:hypothetical protein
MRIIRTLLIAGSAAMLSAGLALGGTAAASASTHTATAHAPKATAINLARARAAAAPHIKHGKIAGVVPPVGKKVKKAPAAGCTEPNCNLLYGGGSVQHSPHVYLLLWGPAWGTDYNQEATASYMESFFHGLGAQPQDNWSSITDQYSDGTGHPSFSGSVYEGAFQDTSTPPTGVDQSQLAAEADAFTSSQGITDATDAQIVIATQSGTCPQGFYASICGGTGNYCAWHSNSNEPYTNLPYILDSGTGCGADFINSNGTYDGLTMVGGHEYAETITDPFPDSGWYDGNDSVSGGEIGDKCAWAGENWGSSDPDGNVTLSTGSYAMQSLWSNSANGCVMSATVTPSYKLTVSEAGTGHGMITSSPAGIHCGGGTCSASFPSGTVVKLTESAPSGTVFTGWNTTGACPAGMSSGTCTVTMTGNKATTASFSAASKLYQEGSASYRGTWTVATCRCSGGADKYTLASGGSASFTFTGKRIQLVSERSSTRGSFKVYLDGTQQTTISNYNATATYNAIVVWSRSFTASGTHTLKIVNIATSGHPRLDVDAFVVST